MSFLFELEVLGKLIIESGLFDSLYKSAQTREVETQQLALRLIDNLLNQVDVSSDTSAEMYLKDLTSLDSLITFLEQNKIKYNNLPIVLSGPVGETYEELKNFPKDLYFIYKRSSEFINDMPICRIYKEGLIDFIEKLKTEFKNNPLTQDVLNKLINKANQDLKDYDINIEPATIELDGDKTPQEISGKTALDAKTILDKIPSVIIADGTVNYTQEGNIPITPETLSSSNIGNLYKQITIKQGDNQIKLDTVPNIVYFLKYLEKRALAKLDEAIKNYYLKIIRDLLKSYSDTSTTTIDSSQDSAEVQQLQSLSTSLPFVPNSLRFSRINDFMKKTKGDNPVLNTLYNNFIKYSGEWTDRVGNSLDDGIPQLSFSSDSVDNLLANYDIKNFDNAQALANILKQILNTTSYYLQEYKERMDNPRISQLIDGQLSLYQKYMRFANDMETGARNRAQMAASKYR